MKKLFQILIAITALCLTTLSFAKAINLYDQPKSDAKVIGTINSDTGIIPIFTPKDNAWIKVGDPTNGNVGWVKSSEIGATNNVTITQQMISTGNGPKSVQVIYKVNPEQEQTFMKQIQEQQKAAEKAFKETMEAIYKNYNEAIKNIKPIQITPEQPETPTKK